jgi:hypothetical protein
MRPPGAPRPHGGPRAAAAGCETARCRRGWRRGACSGAQLMRPSGGAGRRVWMDRRPASPLFLPGRRCPRPPHGGVRRGRKPSPSTGERPCCVDPSDQPFDWSLEPSGDAPRVTQSAAVCRHIPVAVWRRSNGSFAPHDRSCANLSAAARAISNSDICPVFFRRIFPGRMLSGAILHCRPERGRLSLVRRNPQASCTGTARPALAWLWRAWTGWSRAGRCRDERVDNW